MSKSHLTKSRHSATGEKSGLLSHDTSQDAHIPRCLFEIDHYGIRTDQLLRLALLMQDVSSNFWTFELQLRRASGHNITEVGESTP